MARYVLLAVNDPTVDPRGLAGPRPWYGPGGWPAAPSRSQADRRWASQPEQMPLTTFATSSLTRTLAREGRPVAKVVSVVVRAYNEGAHLGRLLRGLDMQTRKPDQVILVDSGSTDDTLDIAKEAGVHDILHIEQERFSFGRSLNLGFEAAVGDLVVVPSAHVYPVYDTWIEHLIRPLESDPSIGVSYGRQVGDHRTKYSEHRLMNRWFPPASIARQDHPFSNNANSCVRRALWEKHRYDESLTGLEDLDFARRLMEGGYFVSYVAEAPVVHVHDESWEQLVNRYRREAIAHRRIFEEQEMPAHEAVRLWLSSIASDLWHGAVDRESPRLIPEVVKFRTAQFLGTWEGFRQSGPVTKSLKERFYYPDQLTRSRPTEYVPGRQIDYDDVPT